MSALIVAFRRLLYLFHDVEKGRGHDERHTFYTYGAWGNGRISVGWHTADTQRSPTCWDPYLSLSVPGRNRNAQLSLHQQLDRWYCHGHIHVVKSRPRWPHTWRYTSSPCHALPWIHVVAVQMVNVLPQSPTNTNWRNTVWFFKPGSVKLQASFWIGIVLLKIYFCVLIKCQLKCKEQAH